MYISVIGAGKCDTKTYEVAYKVGRLVAERGAILISGGLGGVMDAAAKGAKEAGGVSIGILPDDTRVGASLHLSASLPTGLGHTRNTLIAYAADAVIAVGGEYGTLSEIGFALKLGKPVVGIDTWQLKKEGELAPVVVEAATPEEAVDKAFELAAGT